MKAAARIACGYNTKKFENKFVNYMFMILVV